MRRGLQWLAGVRRAFCYEVRWVGGHPKEWLAAIAAPLLWCLLMVLEFNGGIMTNLPVGVVDLDRSAASREVVQLLSAVPSMRLTPFEDAVSADRALRSASIYASITIPENFELDRRRGEGSPVVVQLNKTYYGVGTILEVDVKTALSAAKVQGAVVKTTSAGGTFEANARQLRLTRPDVYFLGNSAFNFGAYLLPAMVPGVMALGALLGFVSSLVREWREGRLREVLQIAGGSPTALLVGKLAPWCAVWLIAGGIWVAGFAGWAGWGAAGSLGVWLLGTALLMLSMAGLAVFAVAVSPTWVIALSVSICLIAPTFPFTGFSFPLDAMTPGAQLFGSLLPLTHYLKLQSAVFVLDSPADVVAALVITLAAFPLVLGGAGGVLFAWSTKRRAAKEAPAVRVVPHDAPQRHEPGFWRVTGATAKNAFFSENTLAVFGAAVAFYLLFYGWPYSGQQVEHIPTGVVDLDRTAASRSFIAALDGTSAVSLRWVLTDEAQGAASLRRGDVDVLVTVPADYSERLARGENATVHVVGNGAYPVKVRALQGAVGGIAGAADMRLAHAGWMTPGTPASMLSGAKLAGPDVLVIHRFNEISGYGNYTVPMVGPVIVQAVILFGVSVSLGNWLMLRRRDAWMTAAFEHPVTRGLGVFLAFWLTALGWFLYMHGFDFSFGEYGAMANHEAIFWVAATFTAAVTALGMALATTLGAGWTAPLTVTFSAPSLFISGAVWPLENMHPFVQGLAQLLPTTPGIRASAAAAQAGAVTADVVPACTEMTLLAVLYLTFALMRFRVIALKENAGTRPGA